MNSPRLLHAWATALVLSLAGLTPLSGCGDDKGGTVVETEPTVEEKADEIRAAEGSAAAEVESRKRGDQ